MSKPGHRFSAYTNLNRANAQSFEGNIAVVDSDSANTVPVITVDGFWKIAHDGNHTRCPRHTVCFRPASGLVAKYDPVLVVM